MGGAAGEVTSLVSGNAAVLLDWTVFAHNAWAGPLTLLGCTVQLLLLMGPAALPGLLATALLVPIQGRFVKRESAWRKEALRHTDTSACRCCPSSSPAPAS